MRQKERKGQMGAEKGQTGVDRKRQKETNRDKQRQKETERDKQRQKETNRDRHRQTETDRHLSDNDSDKISLVPHQIRKRSRALVGEKPGVPVPTTYYTSL